MNFLLYKYTGERNKVNKTPNLWFVLSATGEIKADTSILSPTLFLSLPLEEAQFLIDELGNLIADVCLLDGSATQVKNFNYVYIEAFRRYYYVTNIVVSSNSLCIVQCEVDPLMSFKDSILSQTAIVGRSESDGNPLLVDSSRPMRAEAEFTIEEVSTASGNFNLDYAMEETTPSFVFVTLRQPFEAYADNAERYHYTAIDPQLYTSPSSHLSNIETSYQSNAGDSAIHYVASKQYIDKFAEYVLYQASKDNAVLSVVAFPFEITEDIGKDPQETCVYLWNDWQERVFKDPNYHNVEYSDPKNHVYRYKYGGVLPYLVLFSEVLFSSPSSFLDFPPYTKYELFIPFIGWIELDQRELYGHTITAYYTLSTYDGSGQFNLLDEESGKLLYSASCQLGVQITYTKDNSEAIRLANIQRSVSLTMSSILSLFGAAASVATGNAGGAVLAVAGGVGNVANGVTQIATQMRATQVSQLDARTGMETPFKPYLRKTQYKPVFSENDDLTSWNAYKHQYGIPLYTARVLNTLTGYVVCDKIHLENCNATDIEKSSIVSSLLAGVIL